MAGPELVQPGTGGTSSSTGPHYAFGGCAWLGTDGPLGLDDSLIAVYPDQPSHGAATCYALRCRTRLDATLHPDRTGPDLWFASNNVWTANTIIPQQTNTSPLTGDFQHFGYTNMNEALCAVGVPSDFNGGLGSLLVASWNNKYEGGQPVIFRQVNPHKSAQATTPGAGRDAFVPACTNTSLQALPWTLDATHTAAPKIVNTGLFNGNLGEGAGGAISGPPIQLANGRWLVALYAHRHNASTRATATVIYSDDDGQTWDLLSIIASPDDDGLGRGYQEPNLVLRHDGTIYAMLRVNTATTGDTSRMYSISTDSGATWSVPALIDCGDGGTFPGGASGRPTILEVTDGEGNWMLLHVIRPNGYARMATWSGSYDGINWTVPVPFTAGAGSIDPGTGTGSFPGWKGGWFSYCQLVNRQTRIPGVQDGIVEAVFFCESNSGLPDTINGVSAGYRQQIILAA